MPNFMTWLSLLNNKMPFVVGLLNTLKNEFYFLCIPFDGCFAKCGSCFICWRDNSAPCFDLQPLVHHQLWLWDALWDIESSQIYRPLINPCQLDGAWRRDRSRWCLGKLFLHRGSSRWWSRWTFSMLGQHIGIVEWALYFLTNSSHRRAILNCSSIIEHIRTVIWSGIATKGYC